MPNTFVKIATVTVSGATAANMQFTSIPGTYTDLLVFVSARSNHSAVNTNGTMTFNGSSTGYSERLLYGNGSSAASSNQSTVNLTWVANMPAATATASTFSNTHIYIPNYSGSNNKSVSAESVAENNATSANIYVDAGLWANSAAITSILIAPSAGSLVQYSTATLYGISKS